MEGQNHSNEEQLEQEEKRAEGQGGNQVNMGASNRKEKRKTLKKLKRKQARKEMAIKEREEEEARMNDPEEQRRLRILEEEEARIRKRELKEFEERERAWMLADELKRKKEEEEREEENRRRDLEESRELEVEKDKECRDDDAWEYVEEGPPEIIFQGNEIIFRKKKVRVPKVGATQLNEKEDTDRPTSNPLPPQSEVLADYQSAASTQQILENVAQQVPFFGTEQDKAHCPFHLKTGACRFGQRCSRVHFYPDKSCTLLIKNMYNGPGIAWEQDEGLEYTDEEVEHYYEEFYDDVHTEFLKFGEIVNFKVCKNGSFHLRGNVYVQYKSLESAVLAYKSINDRYFASKQVKCEFVNITRWKVAICGEYMKSRFKTCSHGVACNFIHCFHNPGGDYEWADWDKPPPKYWAKKMAALFGYSDEYEKMEQEHLGQLKDYCTLDRQRSRRSRSSEINLLNSDSGRSHGKFRESTHGQRCTSFKPYHRSESRGHYGSSDDSWSDRDQDKDREHGLLNKSLRYTSKGSDYTNYGDKKKRIHRADSDDYFSDVDSDGQSHHGYVKKSSKHLRKRELPDDENKGSKIYEADRDHFSRKRGEKHNNSNWRSSRRESRVGSQADHGNNKKRNHENNKIEEWFNRDTSSRRHHQHKRSYCDKVLESLDPDSRYWPHETDFNNDDLDSDNHKGKNSRHKRKHLRYLNEGEKCSGDQGEAIELEVKPEPKRARTHKHSSGRDCSSLEIGKADSHDEVSKSKEGHDHRSSRGYKYNKSDDEIKCNSLENIDRWGH